MRQGSASMRAAFVQHACGMRAACARHARGMRAACARHAHLRELEPVCVLRIDLRRVASLRGEAGATLTTVATVVSQGP